MHQGFDLVGRRLDNLLLGEQRREHEQLRDRVERIEQHLGLEPLRREVTTAGGRSRWPLRARVYLPQILSCTQEQRVSRV